MTPALRLAQLETVTDIDHVIALEAASYPANECASPDSIRFRQKQAGAFFYAVYTATASLPVGFVNGTLTTESELTDESMSAHEADGSTLCIHSVVS